MVGRNRRTRDADYVSPTCPPGWAWLLAGILIGMFVSFLFYLREVAPNSLPPENALVPPATENIPSTDKPPPTDFTFFDDLKKPGGGTSTQTPNPNQPITVPGRYLLQVGAFRNETEADGLKTYLNSLNILATVNKTTLSDKGRWYRVEVGPFTDLDKLNQTRARLATNNIQAIVRKF